MGVPCMIGSEEMVLTGCCRDGVGRYWLQPILHMFRLPWMPSAMLGLCSCAGSLIRCLALPEGGG